MSGHRQAALALHGLAEQDQNAILKELPPSDEALLRSYLSELAELGFDGHAVNADRFAVSQEKTGLAGASVDTMLELLAQENIAMTAACLDIDNWPWAAEFLQRLDPHRRRQVEAARKSGQAAPARNTWLRNALEQRLPKAPATVAAGAAKRPSAFEKVKRLWR